MKQLLSIFLFSLFAQIAPAQYGFKIAYNVLTERAVCFGIGRMK